MKYRDILPHNNIERCPVCKQRLKTSTIRYKDIDMFRAFCRDKECMIFHTFDLKTGALLSSQCWRILNGMYRLTISYVNSRTELVQLFVKEKEEFIGQDLKIEIFEILNVDWNDLENLNRKCKTLLTFR